MIVNNYPSQHHRKQHYDNKSPSTRPRRYENEATTSQNPHYNDNNYSSNTYDASGNMSDQSSDNESGFEFSSAYKKKLRRLQKLKEENHEELASMKRKISTRFLLTRAKPNMSVKSVELYILENFDVDEVYVRKNAMKHSNHSTFIFIINSEDELDTDEFKDHDWPGEIRCFFAPNERNKGY